MTRRDSRSAALFPFLVQEVAAGLKTEIERELLRFLAAEQHPLDQCLHHFVPVDWHRHRDPRVVRDLAMFADEHVQDEAVDAVVRAVHGDCADLGLRLAEAVDPALSLLMPGRVPGQVVVHDRLEVFLQVDALGQAVGGRPVRGDLARR